MVLTWKFAAPLLLKVTTGVVKKKGGVWAPYSDWRREKKSRHRQHSYWAAPWQPSHSRGKCAVMEPSGDLINLLIEGKKHPFTVNEHKSTHNNCADMWVIIWYVLKRSESGGTKAQRRRQQQLWGQSNNSIGWPIWKECLRGVKKSERWHAVKIFVCSFKCARKLRAHCA